MIDMKAYDETIQIMNEMMPFVKNKSVDPLLTLPGGITYFDMESFKNIILDFENSG